MRLVNQFDQVVNQYLDRHYLYSFLRDEFHHAHCISSGDRPVLQLNTGRMVSYTVSKGRLNRRQYPNWNRSIYQRSDLEQLSLVNQPDPYYQIQFKDKQINVFLLQRLTQ